MKRCTSSLLQSQWMSTSSILGYKKNSPEVFKSRHLSNSTPCLNDNHNSHHEDHRYKYKYSSIIGGLVTAAGVSLMMAHEVFCEEKNNEEFEKDKLSLEEAISTATEMLQRRMNETGAPGLSIQVSVNGKTAWAGGLGYADVENKISCNADTVMRIASISKSLTMTAVARLYEKGKLNMDAPIQEYLPNFPVKTVDGEKVEITTRHLLSHQSGIRHYKLKKAEKNTDDGKTDESLKTENKEGLSDQNNNQEKNEAAQIESQKMKDTSEENSLKLRKRRLRKLLNKARRREKKKEKSEFDLKEYYIKENFESIEESMKLFEEDELFFKPGSKFLYTTHGWTVVSAVVEAAAGKPFTRVMKKLFHDLGLKNTFLDEHDPIIYNRAKFYIRDDGGALKNAPYVDNSYKWAGGGFLSTVSDLTKFGNAMLYSLQKKEDDKTNAKSFLKPSTMELIWTPLPKTRMGWDFDGGYALGWGVVNHHNEVAYCHTPRHYVSHTGGAIGASSVLLIMPSEVKNESCSGVVVAIICNMQSVGLNKIALEIAKNFEKVNA